MFRPPIVAIFMEVFFEEILHTTLKLFTARDSTQIILPMFNILIKILNILPKI